MKRILLLFTAYYLLLIAEHLGMRAETRGLIIRLLAILNPD
jgi:hypothetical protein